ncbi:MAG: hypothetical protein ACLP04_06165 [Solirubrobacteraceae bacterium]
MSTPREVIWIPKSVVLHVYREAYSILARATEEMRGLEERPDCVWHPERFTGPLHRFDRGRGFLDSLGWQLPDGDAHVAVEQRPVLLDVLSAAMVIQTDLLESGRKDGIDWKSEHEMAAELAELVSFTAKIVALLDSL